MYEEVFNFPGYKRNANQNYTKISSDPVRITVQSKTKTNAGEDPVKQEPLYTVGGNAN
jgi:hypothetical protein